MTKVAYAGGVIRATLAAGPIFVLTFIFGAVLLQAPDAIGAKEALGVILILMTSVAFGMFIALFPVLVGGAGMALAGARWPWARRHEIWAAAGALLGMALVLPFEIAGALVDWTPYALMAATGAICALIVRYGTRWSDNSV